MKKLKWKKIDQFIWRHHHDGTNYWFIYWKLIIGILRLLPFTIQFKFVPVDTSYLNPINKRKLINKYYLSPRFCEDQRDTNLALMLADQNYDKINYAYNVSFNSEKDLAHARHKQLLKKIKRHLQLNRPYKWGGNNYEN